MKMKFRLVTTECNRCHRPIATGNRSLHGADSAKAKYGNICERCVTPQEQHEMNLAIGRAITKQEPTQ